MSDADDLKQKLIDEYLAAEPTPDNSVEIVAQLADKYDKTPNGVRAMLSHAKVYVKKTPTAGTSKSSEDKPKRASKADAIAALNKAIKATGQDPDEEIISKMTGKAALYFAEVISNASQES